MSGNKYLVPDEISLFLTKLEVITKRLQSGVANSEFSTEEQFIAEASNAIKDFYLYLNKPFFDPEEVEPNWDPSLIDYNYLWSILLDDLTVVFTELENVESLSLSNFNSASVTISRLLGRIKNALSKLTDYVLIANVTDPNIVFFAETFNNLLRIETGSSLLNEEECFVNEDEGIITLPIDVTTDPSVSVNNVPTINSSSNGNRGNNEELGADYNGDLSVMFDDNADTWFEYERVVSKADDAGEALILDITVNLGAIKTVNNIRISPNNFGKRTVINLDKIELSKDGITFSDVAQDFSLVGYEQEEIDNLFILGPSAGKYTGEASFTFLPRETKYIRMVFKQFDSYEIATETGTQQRYAIGIRDIGVNGFVFLPKGEIISSELAPPRTVKRVVLEANQTPEQNDELVFVEYHTSPDNGISWHQLKPKHSTEANIAEKLTFNTSEPDSINLPTLVDTLRSKVILQRNDKAFSGDAGPLRIKTRKTTEIHQVPNIDPFEIVLNRKPVDGSVYIIDPAFGSRGIPAFAYILAHGQEQTSDKKDIELPFPLPTAYKKVSTAVGDINVYTTVQVPASERMHVRVGAKEWTHATQSITEYVGGTDQVYNHYTASGVHGRLSFGDGTNAQSPGVNDSISVYFNAERLFPGNKFNDHVTDLEYPTTYSKTRFVIKRYGEITDGTIKLRGGGTRLDLGHRNITNTTGIETKMTALNYTEQRTFINGRDELTTDASWSVDTVNGVVYVRVATDATKELVLKFRYQPIDNVPEDQWDFRSPVGEIANQITIREPAWQTIEHEALVYPGDDIKTFELPHMAVVDGTLTFTIDGTVTGNSPFVKQVPFVDGIQELGTPTVSTTEKIPALTPVIDVATFSIHELIDIDDTTFDVSFSNEVLFQTEVVGAPTAVGQFEVDRNTQTVRVYTTSTVSNPGTITYYRPDASYRDAGLYSVDYKRGIVYTQRGFPGSNDWTVTAKYQYTDYRAEYRIARLVDPDEYTVDLDERVVLFNPEEILTGDSLARNRSANSNNYYVVNYDTIEQSRDDLTVIQKYYSPIVRQYSLRMLLKEN